MLDFKEARLSGLPGTLQAPLKACAAGEVPTNVAVMRLLMESAEPDQAERALASMLEHLDGSTDRDAAERLRAALDLVRANPQAWRTIKSVLHDVRHDGAAGAPDEAIAGWAAAFDRAAEVSPEGSVALYALGNPDLLQTATAEIVARMRSWGLLATDRAVLDLGCGIGRIEAALAEQVHSITAIDVSARMVETARRRCADLRNVTFMQTPGRDLSAFPDGGFDLVLAVDAFPYLVQSGMQFAEMHIKEAARVLRSGGDLLILNFSYRGDPERDRADLGRFAGTYGFDVLRDGEQAFTVWDGLAFHLTKGSGA